MEILRIRDAPLGGYVRMIKKKDPESWVTYEIVKIEEKIFLKKISDSQNGTYWNDHAEVYPGWPLENPQDKDFFFMILI